MRVLFVGHCNDIYIGYLNRVIKNNYTKAITGVVDLNYPGNDLEERMMQYDYTYDTKSQRVDENGVFSKIKFINWKLLIKAGLQNDRNKIKQAIFQDRKRQQKRAMFTQIITAFEPTHVHIHYLNKQNLLWMDVLPKTCKVILSFWGSDLMTTPGGITEYQIQYTALRKAHVITTQTLDLRTILLSKYGQELLPKVHCMTFDPLSAKTGLIKDVSSIKSRRELKMKYNIVQEKICIQVGYSAALGQNHLSIIKQIEALPQSQKDCLAIFIPLTYNASGDYVPGLLKELQKVSFQTIPILEYVTDREMQSIISCCEIFISMRENDALNGAMIESLYAGNVVITGSWLPYGIYQRNTIYFQQIDQISDLKNKLSEVIENMNTIKEQVKGNKAKLESLFNPNEIAKRWANIYAAL